MVSKKILFFACFLLFAVSLNFVSTQSRSIDESFLMNYDEVVTCYFTNSNSLQECSTMLNSGALNFSCSGTDYCKVKVNGTKAIKLEWKSTCEGEPSTTTDGEHESIYFDCQSGPEMDEDVIEDVNCIFMNSTKENSCFSEDGSFGCSGNESCVAIVEDEENSIQKWESTCSGYSTILVDGISQNIYFSCLNTTNNLVTEEVECLFNDNNGTVRKCYSSLNSGALNFSCSGTDKCEVVLTGKKDQVMNWFSDSCQGSQSILLDGISQAIGFYCGANSTSSGSSTKDSDLSDSEAKDEIFLECKNSCLFEGNCYPLGHRIDGDYCSGEGVFVDQLIDDVVCENHFECGSNLCVGGQCVRAGLIRRILAWIGRIFG